MYSSNGSRGDAYHMYPLDLSSSSEGYYSVTGGNRYNVDANRGPSPPPAPRRRSHRPRGCRGGRKNRKNKAVAAAVFGPGILPSDAPLSQTQNFQPSPFKTKSDLSSYQHMNTSKAWDFDPQNVHNSAQKHQMLPPPLPSALFESSHYNMETDGGLKMLPSFDEAESITESIIPPPMEEYNTQVSTAFAVDRELFSNVFDEATLGTVSSSDDSDNSLCNSSVKHQRIELQRQQELESGSLFVISPRSFLLGDAKNNTSDHGNKSTPVW
jgi:hypothetical protein